MARRKDSESVRQRKRGDILDAAMAVFEKEGGLEALSFRKLAAELSLSYSAPYRYFPSKEALVNALRARSYRWIEGVMLASIEGIESPEAQLETLADAYIRAGIERPERYALMFFNVEDPSGTTRSLELRAAKHDALDVCTRTIAAAQACGELPATVDPLTASHLFWIAAHGLVSLQVAGQFEMGRSVQALTPTLIHTLRMGMEHYENATGRSTGDPREETHHG
ncbi:TetR/AcrR family transcriptional regulator [Algiphilus sp. NNCM1]|uniref:TetR/AcrR family transcriptional regulator n=1 Tax=Algiphilus sp. TaxID=1872431 RepID=UPI001CA6372C|nr:TetR/AcrR family transcriptional regulator [Algiphilus sp.]MBY8965215.1 TetR/AcrR family transcriptional regulator [Algiphilus acroporae]MCI5064037.1 TetR/AcrR family transcriptional regulator [Algiphilus sp.]MCI5104806.1 TetR/AcrR family transcriptional regulator [Algiphilus sp.]